MVSREQATGVGYFQRPHDSLSGPEGVRRKLMAFGLSGVQAGIEIDRHGLAALHELWVRSGEAGYYVLLTKWGYRVVWPNEK